MKVCAEPGCPELSKSTRCPTHTRVNDKVRGTRQQRGYGKGHQGLRAGWAPNVATGCVNCWRCDERISPLEAWDLGHCDDDRTQYHGPEHAACNRGARGACTHPLHISPDA